MALLPLLFRPYCLRFRVLYDVTMMAEIQTDKKVENEMDTRRTWRSVYC